MTNGPISAALSEGADAYHAFLARKAIMDPPTGIAKPPKLAKVLFPFQRDIVNWALRRGRAAVFAGTGLGKSLMELSWADAVHRVTGKDILHLAPLAVSAQMVREADKFNIVAKQVKTQGDCEPGTNITNYQKLEHFDLDRFGGVILDECFAAGTMIDTPGGRVRIEEVREGDYILNCAGVDVVSDVHRREVQYAVQVTSGDASITASPNHPFFTQRGWVSAHDLHPGDYTLATGAAMRLVRGSFRARVSGSIRSEILREILLSEMAHGATGALSQSAYAGGRSQAGRQAQGMVSQWRPPSGCRNSSRNGAEPHEQSRYSREMLPRVESHEAQTVRAWGQWDGNDIPSSDYDGCSWRRMDSGVCLVVGQAQAGLPHALQARLRASERAARNRGGWRIAQVTPSGGCKARRDGDFIRVDGVTFLQPGNPELERLRDADGKLYFYDIGATRHPSFSVEGCLVHNSSILKSYDGHYRTKLIQACARIPFRLAATATPAPNDFMELGNHAEFLGVMSYTDMLATFFTHDGSETQKWRLKGHAESEFWRWMASWSVMLRKPSDLGYANDGYDLPPLNQIQHVVAADYAPSMDTGTLFPIQAANLQERIAARRGSVSERVAKAATLTPADRPFMWWCNLNAESEALTKAIPGAVETKGSDSDEVQERKIMDFVEGRTRVLISKPGVCGFGMNFQHCADSGFVGLNDSFEQVYQAIRRFWRFGQTKPVNIHFIASEIEGAVVANLKRKEADADRMAAAMVLHMADLSSEAVRGSVRDKGEYNPKDQMRLPDWLGDAA